MIHFSYSKVPRITRVDIHSIVPTSLHASSQSSQVNEAEQINNIQNGKLKSPT